MEKIALTLPGGARIPTPAGLKPQFSDLGGALSQTLNLVLFLAGILMIIWMSWGIFAFIFSGGEKEKVGKARARITYAIVGFLIVVVAFAAKQYLETIIPQSQPTITPVVPVNP